jgi:WD40 repeat protein
MASEDDAATTAARASEVPGIVASKDSVFGASPGLAASAPHAVVKLWTDRRRPYVVRMTPWAKSLADNFVKSRGLMPLTRAIAGVTSGCIKLVLQPNVGDSASAGRGGSWAARLLGSAGDDGATSAAVLPAPPRMYGTGVSDPGGLSGRSISSHLANTAFFPTQDTTYEYSRQLTEALADARDANEPLDNLEEGRAFALVTAATDGVESLGTDGDHAIRSELEDTIDMRPPSTAVEREHRMATWKNVTMMKHLAANMQGVTGQLQQRLPQIQVSLEEQRKQLHEQLRASGVDVEQTAVQQALAKHLLDTREKFYKDSFLEPIVLQKIREATGKAVSDLASAVQKHVPGGRVQVHRAFLASAGVGKPPPRPTAFLAMRPEDTTPPTVLFTILHGASVSATCVGTRRGTLVAGTTTGMILLWSPLRSAWAAKHEETAPVTLDRSNSAQHGDDVFEGLEENDAVPTLMESGTTAIDDDDMTKACQWLDEAVLRGGGGDGSSSQGHSGRRRASKRGRDTEGEATPGMPRGRLASFAKETSLDEEAGCSPGFDRASVLVGHRGIVQCVALNHSEDWLLSGSVDGTVRLWSVPAGQCVATFRHGSGAVTSVAWNPAFPSFFASGHADGCTRVWSTSQPLCPVRMIPTHFSAVECIAWHPGGVYVASGGLDGGLRVDDMHDGSIWRLCIGHSMPLTALAWSADGNLLCSADSSARVHVWNVSTLTCEGTLFPASPFMSDALEFSPAACPIRAMAVTPDGDKLCVAGTDSRVTVWSLSSLLETSDKLRNTMATSPGREASNRTARFAPPPGATARPHHSLPPHIISADAAAEEAALAEEAAHAAGGAVRPLHFSGVMYGKSSRFGDMAFSRDGVLLVSAVFVPSAN